MHLINMYLYYFIILLLILFLRQQIMFKSAVLGWLSRPDLMAICTYFTKWLIHMNSYDLTHTNSYDFCQIVRIL